MKAVLEGLLFVSGEDGLTKEMLADLLDVSLDEASSLLEELGNDYNDDSRGLMLHKYGNRYKLTTKKEHAEYYKKLVDGEISEAMSPSALETLAIVAYNQPVTRITVDEIRGVSSAHVIRKLVFKNLIKEVGRSELPGRPILYGVTDQFLDYFGLDSIEDLPKIEVPEDDSDVSLYESKYKD